jgi:hypothetical protein
MKLFYMVRIKDIVYDKIAFLIEQQNRWLKTDVPFETQSTELISRFT